MAARNGSEAVKKLKKSPKRKKYFLVIKHLRARISGVFNFFTASDRLPEMKMQRRNARWPGSNLMSTQPARLSRMTSAPLSPCNSPLVGGGAFLQCEIPTG